MSSKLVKMVKCEREIGAGHCASGSIISHNGDTVRREDNERRNHFQTKRKSRLGSFHAEFHPVASKLKLGCYERVKRAAGKRSRELRTLPLRFAI